MVNQEGGEEHGEPAQPHWNVPGADTRRPTKNYPQKMQPGYDYKNSRNYRKICIFVHVYIIHHSGILAPWQELENRKWEGVIRIRIRKGIRI